MIGLVLIWIGKRLEAVTSKQAIYFSLSACHGLGCILDGKIEVYGPAMLLYALLTLVEKSSK